MKILIGMLMLLVVGCIHTPPKPDCPNLTTCPVYPIDQAYLIKRKLFVGILWRDIPFENSDGQRDMIQLGKTAELAQGIVGSPEFREQIQPKDNPKKIVNQFFRGLLGRDMTDHDEEVYVKSGMPYNLVVDYMAQSQEFSASGKDSNVQPLMPLPEIPPVITRHGIVHTNGRQIADDDGNFYPLGATVMWALHGWKFERDRLKQNLDYLKTHHWDYIRILGEVGWPGNEIDPAWPDYSQNLAELIDYAYDKCGLRVEITIIGGGHEDQATSLTQKIIDVVKDGRQHKIMNFEVANESYGRRISLEDMQKIGRTLRQAFPNNLVAISSAEGAQGYRNTGDFFADFKEVFMKPEFANLGTVHMDRGQGDGGWREVRQPWDYKDLPFPMSHNEPIGPRSSVAEEVDPIRLAMLRATGLINGVPAFVLHNGSGVAGQVDPGHNRPANLWEVPNIDAIMDAVRGVDKVVPSGAGTLHHWNNAWAGNPWVADSFWSDGADHGVNRNYTAATQDGWISVEDGIKNYVVMTATNHSVVEVFDILSGGVQSQQVELQAGQTLRLEPVSRDSNGYGALIVIGHYR